MKRIMVAILAVLILVGFNALTFAEEKAGGGKTAMKGDAKGGEKKEAKKEEKKEEKKEKKK